MAPSPLHCSCPFSSRTTHHLISPSTSPPLHLSFFSPQSWRPWSLSLGMSCRQTIFCHLHPPWRPLDPSIHLKTQSTGSPAPLPPFARLELLTNAISCTTILSSSTSRPIWPPMPPPSRPPGPLPRRLSPKPTSQTVLRPGRSPMPRGAAWACPSPSPCPCPRRRPFR